MSIVMHGTNNTCKHLLQLTMFIENCLQGKYIFQCVDVAVNVLPCVVAASRRGRIMSNSTCELYTCSFSKLSVLNDTCMHVFFLFSIE